MLILIGLIILFVVIVSYYFGANEFVVKPLISRRKSKGQKVTKLFLLYAWLLGFGFLVLAFLSFYVDGVWKILPTVILGVWIWFVYLKN